jgi:FlaA1/EpsC-like NDP-sugar epimerase
MTALQEDTWQGFDGLTSAERIPAPACALREKRVLITGAGGSIGSALALAIAVHAPAQLVLLDASEQALYQIDRTLDAPHTPVLASVRDGSALEEIFDHHRPHIVFHAAAFKHVPLMESHPFAAVENNAVGSFLLAQAALRHRAEQVVLVSTDKAVDPAGMMGASKRVAEMTTLAIATAATKIKAVRLGNVYASQGSVVPLFEEQIARGLPVTITHPEATRYFLSLDHAAALLLFALGEEFSSAILVPELGKPIRVEEIAQRLIRQSGSQSQIVYTGLRPGEKLHERLFSDNETLLGEHGALLRAIRSLQISGEEATAAVGELQSAIAARNLAGLLRVVTRLIPAYKPGETVLAQAMAECRA